MFRKDCIEGITVNVQKCVEELESSVGIVTALCPYVGYAKASELAKKAIKEGKKIRQVIIEEKILDENLLNQVLDPSKMI